MAVESIITWGEAAGVADMTQDMARAIAADVTYRLRQTLSVSTITMCVISRIRTSCQTKSSNTVVRLTVEMDSVCHVPLISIPVAISGINLHV